MSDFQGVWVVAELDAGHQLTETSQELLTPARRLGDKLGQTVTGVLLVGTQPTTEAETQLAQLGANQVLVIRHEHLGEYQGELYTAALSQAIAQRQPNVVLFGASPSVTDYAPRVAIRVGGGLMTQALDLDLDATQAVEVTRACYAESLLSGLSAQARPQLVTVKKKAFPKPVQNGNIAASVETFTPALSAVKPRTRLLGVEQAESKGAKKLEEAEIIVSGGRGLKAAEHFSLVEELASALGAAVGASRAVVDAGWRPHAEQVGQTGKTVSPKVYFALGISGAIQHLVGMNTSKIVIAINRDENAPIFKSADFGIVGDVAEVVPALIRAVKEQNLTLHV